MEPASWGEDVEPPIAIPSPGPQGLMLGSCGFEVRPPHERCRIAQ